MTPKQTNPGGVVSFAELTRIFVWAAVMMIGIPGLDSVAHAQFTGPALPISTPVNPPLEQTTDRAILYPASRDIHLDEGDVLSVHIFGETDYAPTIRVGLDGTIQLPLVGTIQVRGLTVPQVESEISAELIKGGMYRDPQITVQITESPNLIATVIGEVHGVVTVGSGKRLFDVLAGAGGLTATSARVITINRPGLAQPIIVNLGTDPAHSAASDIPIFPHDTIVVPRIGVIYLLGAFKNQTMIPLQQGAPLTLMKVAAMGGGTTFGGKFSDLRIIRTSGQTRTVVHVDIKKVIDGKAPDPVLEAEDIVFLPSSALKSAIELGGIGTLLGIASILLYTFRG